MYTLTHCVFSNFLSKPSWEIYRLQPPTLLTLYPCFWHSEAQISEHYCWSLNLLTPVNKNNVLSFHPCLCPKTHIILSVLSNLSVGLYSLFYQISLRFIVTTILSMVRGGGTMEICKFNSGVDKCSTWCPQDP